MFCSLRRRPYQSTDINQLDACCYQRTSLTALVSCEDSLMRCVSASPSAARNGFRRLLLSTFVDYTRHSTSKRDIRRKSQFLPQLWGHHTSEYCHKVWCRKTGMVWLPDSEKKLVNTPTSFNTTNRRTPHYSTWCARSLARGVSFTFLLRKISREFYVK